MAPYALGTGLLTVWALQVPGVAEVVQLYQQLLGAPVVAVAQQEAAGAQRAVRHAALVAERHRPQRTGRYRPACKYMALGLRVLVGLLQHTRNTQLSTGSSSTSKPRPVSLHRLEQ